MFSSSLNHNERNFSSPGLCGMESSLMSLRPLPFPGQGRTKKDVIVFTLRHRFPINTSWKCCRREKKIAFSCVIMMNYCFLSGKQCQWLKIVEVKTCATYKEPWITPLVASLVVDKPIDKANYSLLIKYFPSRVATRSSKNLFGSQYLPNNFPFLLSRSYR